MVNIKWCNNGGTSQIFDHPGLTPPIEAEKLCMELQELEDAEQNLDEVPGCRVAGTTKVELVGLDFGDPRS